MLFVQRVRTHAICTDIFLEEIGGVASRVFLYYSCAVPTTTWGAVIIHMYEQVTTLCVFAINIQLALQ